MFWGEERGWVTPSLIMAPPPPGAPGEGPGPAPALRNNTLVFTLDTEKPLNGKETCAPSLRSQASRRPQARHSAAFVRGSGV